MDEPPNETPMDLDLNFPLPPIPPQPIDLNQPIEIIDIDSDSSSTSIYGDLTPLHHQPLQTLDLLPTLNSNDQWPPPPHQEHQEPPPKKDDDSTKNYYWRRQREKRRRDHRSLALEYAPSFAVFKPLPPPDEEAEIFPLYGELDDDNNIATPYTDAVKVVEGRGDAISWVPSKDVSVKKRVVPSLKELCLRAVAENAEEIGGLGEITDGMKESLVEVLCGRRRMSKYVLGLYLRGEKRVVRVKDCSWIGEEEFVEVAEGMECEKLEVLQLDLCGQCMTDCVLRATLTKSPCSLPSLSTISLKGAYRLSDDGLDTLVTSAPLLSSVNLGQCNLLTSDGIINLADKLNSQLKELYLDDCQNVDAMLILPALKKLKFLEALSVARIQNVCDKFVYNLVLVRGSNIKELSFADCQKLTSASMRAIGENCPQLCALDIENLGQLSESTIRHLANGCRSIQRLKLRHNAFSDEAIAAFLEVSGGSLIELSLNKVAKVAARTALAISLRCTQSLKSLDLSFCRNITDEALGLIVDSCLNLRTLRLFGCTQITELFYNGHSNALTEMIGVNWQTLDQFKAPDFM